MPELQEVFRMATQKIRPDEGALERQHMEQRRRTIKRRAQVYGLVAAMLAIAIVLVVVVGGSQTSQPVRTATPSPPPVIDTTPPMGVQIVDLSGRAVAQIPFPGSSTTPDLSRDGSKIVFSTYTEGSPYHAQIATMRADGSGFQVLTNGPDDATYPRWSPDGTRIAYVTLDTNSLQHIFVMNADGSNVVQLTTGDGYDNAPAWSPNGSRIAFQRGSDASSLDYSTHDEDIWVVPSDGSGEARRLIAEPDSQMQPDWSPNGRWLAFGDNTDLSVVKVSDPSTVYHLRHLPGGPGRFMPRWSPDGSKILFLDCCVGPPTRVPFPNGFGSTTDVPLLKVYVASMANPTTLRAATNLGVTFGGDLSGVSWTRDGELLIDRYS